MPVTLDKRPRSYLAIVAPAATATATHVVRQPANWRDSDALITELNNAAKSRGHVLTSAVAVDRYSATRTVTAHMNKAHATLHHRARPNLTKTPMGRAVIYRTTSWDTGDFDVVTVVPEPADIYGGAWGGYLRSLGYEWYRSTAPSNAAALGEARERFFDDLYREFINGV
ncbi:hypothetical protein [Streptomyces sp. MBT27]|uniref:hypothetical protein n=1 Tax=Streptomyces sp. MBT27 TaxID=1488356 RepID=UPI00141FC688|nr:hypothetical protein [Streptomyces sp. MBT27]